VGVREVRWGSRKVIAGYRQFYLVVRLEVIKFVFVAECNFNGAFVSHVKETKAIERQRRNT
jgi:hypothetical protein